MTREEAKLYADNHMGIYGGRLVDEVVQTIFNDFESRTCENCKHKHIPMVDKGSIYCYYYHSPIYDSIVETDFGCNKFERKE